MSDEQQKPQETDPFVGKASETGGTLPKPRDPIMQFFAYDHLPLMLQAVSAPYSKLAEHIHENVPRNAERTVALRKLLESKDAAVRAAIAK